MLPLPCDASDLMAAICEKSFVNDVAETDGTLAELLELLALLDGEPLLPQAARTRAASARFTSSSCLKTPSSYLAAIVIASALVSQEYQGGRLRRDLMAKLVAMAIDIRPVFVDAFRHPNPQVFE